MKPIIVDMKEMSDTTEVYEARPNPFLVYFIYLLLFLLVCALGWMYFSDIDIVVKSSGIFRNGETTYEISSAISGKVESCNISEGQLVQEGDVLLTIDGERLIETIQDYESMLDDVNQRIEILKAYQESLAGEEENFRKLTENKYYEKFKNRKKLLQLSVENSGESTESQTKQYETEKGTIEESIYQYETQVSKLEQVKGCIQSRTNIFGAEDSYYSSMVESYISNYNVTSLQYDSQIQEYRKSIETLKKQKKYEQVEEVIAEIGSENPENVTKEGAEEQIETLNGKIQEIESEKSQALKNLELQQLTTIEQQISSRKETLLSLKSNQTSVQAQIDALQESQPKDAEEISVLTEKGKVAGELLTYEDKRTEYENTLKQYNMENGKVNITATNTGYVSLNGEIREGTYLQEGTTICQLLPEKDGEYYADIYVDNSDIAELKEGQQVKFEIAAYPSSEYGFITGEIETIAKDIKVDQTSQNAYYPVKVKCKKTTLVNKEGKIGEVKNGMSCQAKIVVDKKRVLTFLLEKIHLTD